MSVIVQLEFHGLDPIKPDTYLEDADVQRYPKDGWIRKTTSVGAARRFHDAGEAFQLWKEIPKHMPVRHDGKPNRPLSAYTITIIKI